MTIDESGWM